MESAERLKIIDRINEYERLGLFDRDVEDDPESIELLPDDIKYLNKSPWASLKRMIAYKTATRFFNKNVKNNQIIIKEIKGLENLSSVKGAVLTCNHFNPIDSFIMQYVFRKSKHKKRMYRIIREGNYTSFKGFYGFLMRNCDTLPLSSNTSTMKKFSKAVNKVLNDGNCLLVYPEQSLWWNYRKPKPLQNGAFHIAIKNNVPVIPIFITMQDSRFLDKDGFPVQEHTVHIGEAIYPIPDISKRQTTEKMKQENFEFNKTIYEEFYKTPLIYNTK